MRLIIYGTLLTVFVVCAGAVQAANDLDGKALFCKYKFGGSIPFYGLVFSQGEVTRHEVRGYSKTIAYKVKYHIKGTNEVRWRVTGRWTTLNRETLKVNIDQCSFSSKKEILQKLDGIIANAKKKNKM